MSYLGIDPGRQGALAAIGNGGATIVLPVPIIEGGGRHAVYDLVAIRDLVLDLHRLDAVGLAVVERLDTLPPSFRGAGGRVIAAGGGYANHARGEALGKPSDGFADALLMAELARRIHLGGELFGRQRAGGAGEARA